MLDVMQEWLETPVIVVAALAVLGILWKAARWTSKVDSDLVSLKDITRELKDITKELRADIKQILSRLPAPPIAEGSPVQLTEFGKKISEWLEAKKWASDLAESLLDEINRFEPFEVDEFCDQYTRTRLTDHWQRRVRKCAYEFGTKKAGVQSVMRVVLRDELLSRNRQS